MKFQITRTSEWEEEVNPYPECKKLKKEIVTNTQNDGRLYTETIWTLEIENLEKLKNIIVEEDGGVVMYENKKKQCGCELTLEIYDGWRE